MSPAAHLPFQQGQMRRAIPPIRRLLSLMVRSASNGDAALADRRGGCLAGRAAFESVDGAAAVDEGADDHTEVADSTRPRTSRAGRVLDRGEYPVQLSEPVDVAAGVELFPGVVERRGERA